jgi:hypothetical protein
MVATNLAGAVPPANASTRLASSSAAPPGYYLVGADGGVFAFNGAPYFGSLGGNHLGAPVVGMALAPASDDAGYYLAGADGGVYAFGHAPFSGSLAATHLDAPITDIERCPDYYACGGYYLVGADGGVFTFGDAPFFGSLANVHLAAPIVKLLIYSDCGGSYIHQCYVTGYYLVASDGGVFTFGDAPFKGSLGNVRLAAPIVGAENNQIYDGVAGYTLVGSDGGTFTFGIAQYFGSLAGVHLNAPIVGIVQGSNWLVGADGGVFTFPPTPNIRTLANTHLNAPIVAGEPWYPGG